MTDWNYILTFFVIVATTILGIWTKVSFAKKSDIYSANGATKFPTITTCDKTHRETHKTLIEIKQSIKDMDDKRENSKTEITDSINRLTQQVGVLQGKVDTFVNLKSGGVK